MKKTLCIVVSVIVLSVFTLSSCQSNDAGIQNNVAPVISVSVVNYNNGVYYFPFTDANFANNLSAFISQNPNLQLLAISGDGAGGYGRNFGYFVVFKQVQ